MAPNTTQEVEVTTEAVAAAMVLLKATNNNTLAMAAEDTGPLQALLRPPTTAPDMATAEVINKAAMEEDTTRADIPKAATEVDKADTASLRAMPTDRLPPTTPLLPASTPTVTRTATPLPLLVMLEPVLPRRPVLSSSDTALPRDTPSNTPTVPESARPS